MPRTRANRPPYTLTYALDGAIPTTLPESSQGGIVVIKVHATRRLVVSVFHDSVGRPCCDIYIQRDDTRQLLAENVSI